jgi:hypothetical protein
VRQKNTLKVPQSRRTLSKIIRRDTSRQHTTNYQTVRRINLLMVGRTSNKLIQRRVKSQHCRFFWHGFFLHISYKPKWNEKSDQKFIMHLFRRTQNVPLLFQTKALEFTMIVAVAVAYSPPPQHSPILGHRASSHTCA